MLLIICEKLNVAKSIASGRIDNTKTKQQKERKKEKRKK